uniref:Uncharacterized protein n=1 Tax=Anopheles stephensi TaxID=30069 RepID=A0A182YEW6_ANOST
MQLMTFNSLLMFDIVFIFFLFLVGVTCLVYYLPPRELTPHDVSAASSPPPPCSAFPSPASGGPLVRGCASTARRISGEGGTPIILVGVRSEAAEQQQHQQHQQQQQQQQQELSQGWSPITGYHRFAQNVLTTDSVRVEPEPGEIPAGQLYPYPVRMDRGQHQQHQQQQQQQQLFLHQERQDEQEVLLLDCSLEDIIALRRMAHHGEVRLPPSAGLSDPCRNCCCQYQPSVDRWTSTPPIVPLPPTPPPRTVRPGELHYQQEAEVEVEEDEEEDNEEDEEDHQRVQYVRIEIERGNGSNGTVTGSSEPMSMPACCYVRAKDTDIRACSGPIHDV